MLIKPRRGLPALAALVLIAGAVEARAAETAGRLRALVFSGKNNHDWKRTTPALKKILEDSGRFSVDVTDDPGGCNPASFAEYDVLVSNWTNWPKVKEREWGPQVEKAFVDLVRGGKGFALFHAASTPFQNWPAFQRMVGATWALGKTGHGAIHAFKVTVVDKDHPVTRGMPDFRLRDELWHRMGTQPDVHVLCKAMSAKKTGGSGALEPVALCTPFGKGRCFNLVLGHDVTTMRNVGWQTLMLRGTEWAATGKVTIAIPSAWPAAPAAADLAGRDPQADLPAIAKYAFGQDRAALARVEAWVRHVTTAPASRKALAAKLSAMLGPEADTTSDCKKFVCGQLSLIGSAAEVPALAGLLDDKDLSLAARSALERIPGKAASAALRQAMTRSRAPVLIGLINTLGERRDADAVDAVARHLVNNDAAVAAAAVDALGKIGGLAAVKALSDVRATLPAGLQVKRDNALIACAAGLARSGKITEAEAIYREMSALDKPVHVRIAAFSGRLTCSKNKRQALLLAALKGKDRAVRSAAIGGFRATAGSALTKAFAEKLSTSPPDLQVQLLVALSDRGDRTALPAVTRAVETSNRDVRRAALAALGPLGDAATLQLLAGLVAKSSGTEQRIIRKSLARLHGTGIDAAMVGLMEKAEAPVRVELITALSARNARSAIPALLRAAKDSDPKVRAAAVKALGVLGDVQTCRALIRLLGDKTLAESDSRRIEDALTALCRRGGRGGPAVDAVVAAMPGVGVPQRRALLRVLGRAGDVKALEAVLVQLDDAALADDAGLAAVQIAKDLWRSHPAEVKSALRRVLAAGKSPSVRQQACIILLLKLAQPRNLALGATASSPDGIDKDGAAGGDQAAIDGKDDTYWDEADGQKCYRLKVSFKAATEVSAIRILGYRHHDYAPKDFEIVCDDKVVKTVRGATYCDNELLVVFPETRCKSLTLSITGYYGQSPGIRELGIYSVSPPEQPR